MSSPEVEVNGTTEPVIKVLSRSEAETYVPEPGTICISINGPQDTQARLSSDFADILYLGFDDIKAPHKFYQAFHPRQAVAVLEFVGKHMDANTIVVHCQMGASRSPGVALGICDAFGWSTESLEAQFPFHNAFVREELEERGERLRRQDNFPPARQP